MTKIVSRFNLFTNNFGYNNTNYSIKAILIIRIYGNLREETYTVDHNHL